jgi:hypothetical protein
MSGETDAAVFSALDRETSVDVLAFLLRRCPSADDAADCLGGPGDARRAGPDHGVAQLSPIDQEIITMSAWDGLTPREIGSVLGMSPNLARVRAHRARAKLRSLLGREFEPGREPASADRRRG